MVLASDLVSDCRSLILDPLLICSQAFLNPPKNQIGHSCDMCVDEYFLDRGHLSLDWTEWVTNKEQTAPKASFFYTQLAVVFRLCQKNICSSKNKNTANNS